MSCNLNQGPEDAKWAGGELARRASAGPAGKAIQEGAQGGLANGKVAGTAGTDAAKVSVRPAKMRMHRRGCHTNFSHGSVPSVWR